MHIISITLYLLKSYFSLKSHQMTVSMSVPVNMILECVLRRLVFFITVVDSGDDSSSDLE